MLKRAALEGAMQTLKDEAKEIAQTRSRARRFGGGKANEEAEGRRQAARRSLAAVRRRAEETSGPSREGKSGRRRHRTQEAKEARRRVAGRNASGGGQQSTRTNSRGKEGNQQQPQAASRSGQTEPVRSQQNSWRQQNKQATSNAPVSRDNRGAREQNARDARSRWIARRCMKEARESQVNQWKSELTNALDQSIQEMLQMARQEQQLEQKARSGESKPEELRASKAR
jgi:hypothetical protein